MSAGIERDGLFAATGPDTAGRLSIVVRWQSVGFVHWSYAPDAVERLLPPGVSADLYGGRAWAGYQFLTVSPPWGRRPHDPTELNRTLDRRRSLFVHHEVRAVAAVVDRFGRPGAFHLSVDTDGRLIAATLRRRLNLAAYEAESKFSLADHRADYWTKRPDGTAARLKLTIGGEVVPTDVDRFLTARWRIVLPPRRWDPPGESRTVPIVHEPWTLHRSSLDFFDDEVLMAAGLPPAAGPGQALWSPGRSVRIGRPSRES